MDFPGFIFGVGADHRFSWLVDATFSRMVENDLSLTEKLIWVLAVGGLAAIVLGRYVMLKLFRSWFAAKPPPSLSPYRIAAQLRRVAGGQSRIKGVYPHDAGLVDFVTTDDWIIVIEMDKLGNLWRVHSACSNKMLSGNFVDWTDIGDDNSIDPLAILQRDYMDEYKLLTPVLTGAMGTAKDTGEIPHP